MAKYILYNETDEGKSVLGEYKRKTDLREDATKILYTFWGNPNDLDNIFKLSDDEYEEYKEVLDEVKYLMKTGKTIYCDNIFTYEKK